jgi:tripartite-type tricarboxylate transporter receptor subunit TctC
MMRGRSIPVALVILFSTTLFVVHAQPYPNKPIRVVVPFAAGGSADGIARVVAQPLSEALGQTVVLDNRAGAGGTIGANMVAQAAPDGYTLLISATGPNAVAPSVYRNLPYDPLRSFAPIGRLSVQPSIIVVNPSLGVKTVSELIALASAKPGQLNFGSPGVGTTSHLGGELFKSLAKIDIVHVPYKTGPVALTDLISGQLNVIFDNIGPLIPHVKSGKIRALAVASAARTPLLPELPTAAESGLPGFEYSIWFGVSAPSGTPAAIVALWNSKIAGILKSQSIKDTFTSMSAEVSASTPQEFQTFIAADVARWAKIVKFARIAPQ